MATAKRLPSGSWSVNIYVGKDKDGKRKYKRFTGPDKRRVEREAAAYADEHRGEVSADTFGYAARQYIESRANVLSPSTILNYKRINVNYLLPWENLPIEAVDAKLVQEFVNEKSAQLSSKTVHNIYGFITAVVYSVYPDRRFSVTLPAKERKFKDLPDPKKIIMAVHNTKWELPVLLAMWQTLRISEIRGLRYGDISGNILTVHSALVRGEDGYVLKSTTKTYDSTRRLLIPPYIKYLIGDVESHSPDDYIVPYTYNMIYGGFQKSLKAAGLPPMPFHDLRHMSASIMLFLGFPDKLSMERGGWHSNHVLQDRYQHIFTAERLAREREMDNYIEGLLPSDAQRLLADMQHENATRENESSTGTAF